MERHDDAARDQQGDVRRMSRFSLSLRDAPAPLAALEISAHARRRRRAGDPRRPAGRHRARVETAARPGAGAVADRAEHPRPRGGRGGVSAACSSSSAARAGSAWSFPIRWPRCRWCEFEQVPATDQRPRSADPLAGAKGAPFPIEDAQVSYVPGAADRRGAGVHRHAGAARRRSRSTRTSVPRPARTPASSTCRRSMSSTPCWRPAAPDGRLAAGERLGRTGLRWRSCAARTSIFFRSRGADGDGTLADLVHQTAMYYEDRLRGPGLQPGDLRARRRDGVGGRADLRRSLERPAGDRRRNRRSARRRDADRPHRRGAGAARDPERRSSACCCATQETAA